jgi:hypothetical protein
MKKDVKTNGLITRQGAEYYFPTALETLQQAIVP